MDREAVIRMAQGCWPGDRRMWSVDADLPRLERFAALVADAEREKLAAWMMRQGYATGHGDSIEKLLEELEWQIAEREREACAKILFDYAERDDLSDSDESLLKHLFELIRARGK